MGNAAISHTGTTSGTTSAQEMDGKNLQREVVKKGWLQKRGEYITTWRKRYFVLFSDGGFSGFKTMESVEDESGEKQNNFTVEGCQIMTASKPKPFTFIIRGLQLTSVVERMFSVDTETQRQSWVEAIEKVKEGLAVHSPAGGTVSTNENPLQDYELLKVLGRGTFGKVVLCREKKNQKLYAMKILRKEVIVSRGEVEHTMAEKRVLESSAHPFIISLRRSFTTEDRLCLVMEYVNGGELFVHLGKEHKFTEERTRFYGAEIASALGYLHKNGIVYRDLKLENLLLDSDGHIKVADMGLVKEGVQGEDTTKTFCGTPEYLAPELLHEMDYGTAVDWWALGCVMYEMMSGRLPFYSRDQTKLFTAIMTQKLTLPGGISSPAKALLSGLLSKDPAQRLGAGPGDVQEIKEHQFFQAIDWKALEEKRLTPPFKPVVNGLLDTKYFDSEFTDQSVALTPPNTGLITPITEEEENVMDTTFNRFSTVLDN